MNLNETINKLVEDGRHFTFRMDIESNPMIKVHAPLVGMDDCWIHFDRHDNKRTAVIGPDYTAYQEDKMHRIWSNEAPKEFSRKFVLTDKNKNTIMTSSLETLKEVKKTDERIFQVEEYGWDVCWIEIQQIVSAAKPKRRQNEKRNHHP